MLDAPPPLLDHLSETYQSGEALARRLGVSRVAVWKQAQALREAGYPVEVARGRGYRLAPGTPTPARLAPRLKGRFGRPYRYLGRAASTQDVLREWAEAGAPEGALVLAEQQTQGRGRRGRGWASPAGAGLYASLLLRPALPLTALPRLTLAAGVALAEAAGVGGLKWPNDLLAPDGKKLAGVLLEADMLGEEVRYVLLGVGLNVHESPLPEGAAYLEAYRPARRVEVLAHLLERLEHWYARLTEPEAILAAWRARSYTLGRPVRVRWVGGVVEGVAVDLEADGTLVVEDASGKRTRISAGDVELVGGVR